MSATLQIESLRDQAEREGWLETFVEFDRLHSGARVKDLVETVLKLERQIAATVDDDIDEPPPSSGLRVPPALNKPVKLHGFDLSQISAPIVETIERTAIRNSHEVLAITYDGATNTLTTESKRTGDLLALAPVTPQTVAALLKAPDFDAFYVTHVEPFITERKPLGNVHDALKQCNRCEQWKPTQEMKHAPDPKTPTIHVPVWLCQTCRA